MEDKAIFNMLVFRVSPQTLNYDTYMISQEGVCYGFYRLYTTDGSWNWIMDYAFKNKFMFLMTNPDKTTFDLTGQMMTPEQEKMTCRMVSRLAKDMTFLGAALTVKEAVTTFRNVEKSFLYADLMRYFKTLGADVEDDNDSK